MIIKLLKKMIKKILIVFVLLIIVYLFYSPIAIELQTKKTLNNITLKANDTFKLKEFIDFNSKKKYDAYIVIDREELTSISSMIHKYNILVSHDTTVIRYLFDNKFKYTDADVSTIQSKIYIYCENSLVFESQISLEDNSLGFQNSDFGWVKSLEPRMFLNSISKFERYNLPILLITN